MESGEAINVSLETELKDSMTHFIVGDEVRVYYDGNIVESETAEISTVYAITLVNPSEKR